ncbi:MAG TPA: dTDP-4-dehydrorhamnose 3,5-epimerase [Puia sp.]|jgi:dTDP-4-dehydrorhamnose 3,5-epimerase|nr:dTDP-4-dehydrorhamnose 3,5-epimerase [Puia sp.]
MPFKETPLPGVIIFEPTVYPDERGFFYESYNKRLFHDNNILNEFVQDNQSYSVYGVIRGLHYQKEPYAQSKLVRVLQGEILDIVLDIRVGSPGFGKIYDIRLSSENKKQIFVPKGFAHGFSVLSETAVITYKCDQFYNKQSEAGIRFNDLSLNINWQIPPDKALISGKDMQLPEFNPSISDFIY